MNRPLPDTSTWQPRKKAGPTLSKAFFLRCQQAERAILNKVSAEVEMNVDNFDSGLGVEDIIRESLSDLLPRRYSVTEGLISDCLGSTSGDSDVIVFNDTWFPSVKQGATGSSRRKCLPIEGVYATIEVKQTLTEKTLDEAAKKLVTTNRLFRPKISNNYVTENRVDGVPTRFLANPLFTAIIATGLDESFDINEAIQRFVLINQSLPRTEMIQVMCVLDNASCFWVPNSDEGFARRATFMDQDLELNLMPAMVSKERGHCPFYYLVSQLYAHCNTSILSPESFETAYALGEHDVAISDSAEYSVRPTNEHIGILSIPVVPQYIKRKDNEGNEG